MERKEEEHHPFQLDAMRNLLKYRTFSAAVGSRSGGARFAVPNPLSAAHVVGEASLAARGRTSRSERRRGYFTLTATCALVQQHWKPPPPSPVESLPCTRRMYSPGALNVAVVVALPPSSTATFGF